MRNRALLAVLGAFTLTVALLFLSIWVSIKLMSGVRAYVGGEGLYSKAQKNAVYFLALYVQTGKESWYNLFDKSLGVPEGDRNARIELERKNPNWDAVRRDFIQGGNSPLDVDNLIFVFLKMRRDPYVNKAIRIWREADGPLAELRGLGHQIHAARHARSNGLSPVTVMVEVEAVNQQLTILEDQFSSTLGAGARSAGTRLLFAILALSIALWATGIAASWRLVSALARERERLRATIDNAPLGIVLLDAPGGKIRMANSQAWQLLGLQQIEYTESEYGDRWLGLSPQGNRMEWSEYPIAKALGGEIVRNQDLQWARPDGVTVWLRVGAAPIWRRGIVAGAVTTFYDITEERRVEEALLRRSEELARSNADLEQFAYATSHDLQEPLRNIGIYSQLLTRQLGNSLDAQTKQIMQVIHSGVHHMTALITGLLAYSRVSNLNAVPMSAVDLNQVLEWACSNLKAKLEENGAAIHAQALPVVWGDKLQIVQLLQNLIENAVKYRSPSTPVIRIAAEKQGQNWLIAVEDNGIGIAPEYQDRIFGLFKRLHGKSVPGTGIGLALAKRVIERHGGRIWVESRYGHGATFRFTLLDAANSVLGALADTPLMELRHR